MSKPREFLKKLQAFLKRRKNTLILLGLFFVMGCCGLVAMRRPILRLIANMTANTCPFAAYGDEP